MEFLLRQWQTDDAPSVAKHANNPKIEANLRDGFPQPYTLQDAQTFIAGCLAAEPETGPILRAIVVQGSAVGSIGIFPGSNIYCKSAELGYWLSEEYWGQGIVSRAVRSLCQAAFATRDLARIYATPYAYNLGSRRVLEKAGFTLEGIMRQGVFKHGKLHDYYCYALLRQDIA